VLDYVFLSMRGVPLPEKGHLLAPSNPHVDDSPCPTLSTGSTSNGATGRVQHQGMTQVGLS
jgi:hypothetical protein